MDRSLDPTSWYSNRELEFTPLHFTVASTPITLESKLWILDKLRGRFSIISGSKVDDFASALILVNSVHGVPAFEDPKEASLYELTWS